MTTLTPEQHQAVESVGMSALPMTDPQSNTEYVLIRADVFRQMQDCLDEGRATREEEAFLSAAKRGARGRLLDDE
jgi:hypothetical protein